MPDRPKMATIVAYFMKGNREKNFKQVMVRKSMVLFCCSVGINQAVNHKLKDT